MVAQLNEVEVEALEATVNYVGGKIHLFMHSILSVNFRNVSCQEVRERVKSVIFDSLSEEERNGSAEIVYSGVTHITWRALTLQETTQEQFEEVNACIQDTVNYLLHLPPGQTLTVFC